MQNQKTIDGNIRVDVVKVDPETASNWLSRNFRNRPVNEKHVKELARAIQCGEWKMNAEPIKFSKDGALIDGQHRLKAVVASGKAIQMMAVWGVDNEAFDTMDQGVKRTSGHILHIGGEKDANNLAAIARLYLIVKQNPENPNMSEWFSPQVIEKTVRMNGSLRDALAVGHKIKKISTTSIAGAMWALFQEKNRLLANEFIDRLEDGAGLSKYSPIKTLRDALMINKVSQRKLLKRDVIAYYIKAWNSLRNGKELRIMRFQDAEQFPIII